MAALGIVLLVRLCGADRVAGWIKAVWQSSRNKAPVMALICFLPLVSACSAFPRTTAAYETGGVGAAIDTLLGETQIRVVATCELLDGTRLSSIIEVAGAAANVTELIEDTREDRRLWCNAFGGALSADVQNLEAAD